MTDYMLIIGKNCPKCHIILKRVANENGLNVNELDFKDGQLKITYFTNKSNKVTVADVESTEAQVAILIDGLGEGASLPILINEDIIGVKEHVIMGDVKAIFKELGFDG